VLLSVGEDRMMHRYDVASASLFNGLKVIVRSHFSLRENFGITFLFSTKKP
jgi:hypothetical protein